MAVPTTNELTRIRNMCPIATDLPLDTMLKYLDKGTGGYSGPPSWVDPSRVYYVSKVGSDSNDGKTWDTAFLTVQKAFTTLRTDFAWATSGTTPGWPDYRPSVVYIAPGTYEEQLTALPWQTYVVGLGEHDQRGGNGGVKIKYDDSGPVVSSAAGAGITMLGCHIENIIFECNYAGPCVRLSTMQSSRFVNCTFYRGDAGTYGLEVGTAATGPKDSDVIGCRFVTGSTPFTHGIYCNYAAANTYAFHNGIVRDCVIEASSAGIFIHASAVATGCRIIGNYIYGAAIGIDDNNGNSYCFGNFISATDAIEHAGSTTHCVGNHVSNDGTGAMETANS